MEPFAPGQFTPRVLRLVNDARDPAPPVLRNGNIDGLRRGGEDRVAHANRQAAHMAEDDARWVFAREVSDSLEGGRAAILPPGRRRELVAAGVRRGLRPFEANLVIAMVQDHARESGAGLARDRLPWLGMVRAPGSPAGIPPLAVIAGVVLVLATLITGTLISWLTG